MPSIPHCGQNACHGVRGSAQTSFLVALLLAMVVPTGTLAQDLVVEALDSFPRETIRVEYSSPAKLRDLPNYGRLRQRYVGAWLEKLEASLAQIGIREGEVDELMLGWLSGAPEADFFGLATGRFKPKATAQKAAAEGVAATLVEGQPAYCVDAGLATRCVVILGDSRGALGRLALLAVMLQARNRPRTGLEPQESFVKLVREAQTQAPIWGIAVGPAIVDWFKAWMPGPASIQVEWSRLLQPVTSLAYSVEVSDQLRLEVKLDCAAADAAATLRQVLEGVRAAQQLAWQSQYPNLQNPFATAQIELHDRRVLVRLAADYSALEGVPMSGKPAGH